MREFLSDFRGLGAAVLPPFTGTRAMMLPFLIGRPDTLPDPLHGYRSVVDRLSTLWPFHRGEVGYLTVDERVVPAGQAHRRPGLHVDGVYGDSAGSWSPPPGSWGSLTEGMLTVASHAGCRAWRGRVEGGPGPDGECDRLALPGEPTTFQPNEVYWVGGLCVHESVPMPVETPRQFVRVSMPSCAPWFEGYTRNPLGIEPTGPILPRREQMEYAK